MARTQPYVLMGKAFIAALCLLAGCQSQQTNPSQAQVRQPPAADNEQAQKQLQEIREARLRLFDPKDPCATRLHDIAGPLLLYYHMHDKLPPKLEDLKEIDPNLQFTCPASGKPYIYNLDGVHISEPQGWLLVYDADPVHHGLRWGIVVMEPQPNQPLSADVLAILDKDLVGGGNR